MKKKQNTEKLEELFSVTPAEQSKLDALVLAARFLEEVQKVLEERKMTRKSLAEAMGTSASWLTQMFRGDKLPNLENLVLMAKILGIEFQISAVSKVGASTPSAITTKRKTAWSKRNQTKQPAAI